MFLNITPTIVNWTNDNMQFSLIFDENPLADFVELPDDGRAQDELWYSNILCGILRGALEMVSFSGQLDHSHGLILKFLRYVLAHTDEAVYFRYKCKLRPIM